MRVVLRKWTPRYKYKNFLTHFRLSLFPGCFSENLTTISLSQIFIPYKFALSGCIPPKIKCEILAHNGSQTTRARSSDSSSSQIGILIKKYIL